MNWRYTGPPMTLGEAASAHGLGGWRRVVDHIRWLVWPGYRDRSRRVLVRRRCRRVGWKLDLLAARRHRVCAAHGHRRRRPQRSQYSAAFPSAATLECLRRPTRSHKRSGRSASAAVRSTTGVRRAPARRRCRCDRRRDPANHALRPGKEHRPTGCSIAASCARAPGLPAYRTAKARVAAIATPFTRYFPISGSSPVRQGCRR